MMCDLCQKHKATVYFKAVVNGRETEMNLCESCAKEKGMWVGSHLMGLETPWLTDPFQFSWGKDPFSLPELVASLAHMDPFSHRVKSVGRCNQCGLTLEEFQKTGRLGCAKCFRQFQSTLETVLKHIHGSAAHAGKSLPKGTPKKAEVKGTRLAEGTRAKSEDELSLLREKLRQAVAQEDYEQAAQLRDEIKKRERGVTK